MAQVKLQSSMAIKVVPSDTIPIPYKGSVQATGTATSTTSNKLVNSAGAFTTTGIKVGFTVVNTTDNTIAKVTAIDSATTLSLSADIMASGETYVLYGEELNPGCNLYVGVGGDVKVVMMSGDIITLKNAQNGSYHPINCKQVYSTGTTATDIIALW